MPDATDTAMLLAYLALAAAETQNRLLYETMRSEFDNSARANKNLWRMAECHAIVARADLAACEFGRAREEALLTLHLAERTCYAEYEVEAEAILHAIASANRSGHGENTPHPETPGIARIADDLAHDLCHAVTT